MIRGNAPKVSDVANALRVDYASYKLNHEIINNPSKETFTNYTFYHLASQLIVHCMVDKTHQLVA